jgi:uncharacterized membrane protein YebE (DUF533 family)
MSDSTTLPRDHAIPVFRIAGCVLLAAFISLMLLDAGMRIPGGNAIPPIGGALTASSTMAFMSHGRKLKGDAWLIVVMFGLVGILGGTVSTMSRGDREIGDDEYARIAADLRARPELERFIVGARSDGVINAAERDAFDEDVVSFDRNKVLGR